MRKIIKICSLLFLFAMATYAQNTTLTIGTVEPDSVGEKITVPINVSNFTNVGSITLKILYNSSAVTLDSASNPGGEYITNASGGTITIARAELTPAVPENGKLIDLYFTYHGGSTGLSFDVANSELTTTDGGVITGVTYNSGGIVPEAITVDLGDVTEVAPNSEISIPVTVSNFENVGSITWKIAYNSAVLEFNSISGASSDEYIAGVSGGLLTIARAELDPAVPTDGELISLNFTYLGGNTDLTFNEAESEVTDISGNVIAGISYGTGSVSGAQIDVDLGDVNNAVVGSGITIPVNVENFNNVGSITWKIQLDPSVIQFDSLSNDEYQAGVSGNTLTIARAELDPAAPSTGTLLNLYFTYLGGSTSLVFDVAGSEVTTTDGTVVTGINYSGGTVQGDVSLLPSISLGNVLAGGTNSTVAVPLSVDNFTNVGSVTLKIQFNPAVASFDSVSSTNGFIGGVSGNTITIARAELDPVMPDSGKIGDLYFTYMGGATNLTFDQGQSEVTDLNGNVVGGIVYEDGSIGPGPADVSVTIGSVMAESANETIAVPVTVTGFDNVGSITWKILYNPTVATFDSVGGVDPNEYLASASGGVITIARAELTPAEVTDGKLLDLYFTFHDGGTALTFDVPANEVTDVNGNILTVDYFNGSISDNGLIRVDIGDVQAEPNSSVAVPVEVDNFENIGSITWEIQFNPAIATFDSVSSANADEYLASAAGGVITVARAELSAVVPDSGKIFDLYFTYHGGSTPLNFDAAASEVTDVNGNVITGIVYINGSISFMTAPVFTSVLPDTTVAEGDTLTFIYTATDPQNDELTYSLISGPAGASIDPATGMLMWAVGYDDAGVDTIVVGVTDGTTLVTTSAVVTVMPTNRPPMFLNTLPDTTVTHPNTFTFQYEATDPDGDTLTFGLVDPPAGASINEETGLFTYTPPTDELMVTFIVSVSDGQVTVYDTTGMVNVPDPVIEELGLPTEFAMEQNYPNPFNPATKIRFAIPSESFVTLKVYNLLGQEVMTLVNEYLPAAFHEYDFDASKLSSGVYIYRIKAGDFISTKKMTLIK